jgi:peptide deformylase
MQQQDEINANLLDSPSYGIEPVLETEYKRFQKQTEEYLEQVKPLQDFKESDLDILNELKSLVIHDKQKLSVPCEKIEDIKEGEEIASKLFRFLTFINKTKMIHGSGLSANQIGINKRVCVIHVKEPIYLINPVITNASGECNYFEGCLSFPGEGVKTNRFTTFNVKADNIEGELLFDVSDIVNTSACYYDDSVFEAMTIQHEIDHLNGITMFDRKIKPTRAEQRLGRNDRVTITDGKEFLTIKFKNFDIYEKKGFHILPTV